MAKKKFDTNNKNEVVNIPLTYCLHQYLDIVETDEYQKRIKKVQYKKYSSMQKTLDEWNLIIK